MTGKNCQFWLLINTLIIGQFVHTGGWYVGERGGGSLLQPATINNKSIVTYKDH